MGNRHGKNRNSDKLDEASIEMLMQNTFMTREEILAWYEDFKVSYMDQN
jgi:hypothetical protein